MFLNLQEVKLPNGESTTATIRIHSHQMTVFHSNKT
jgi:hypothetical protein